MWDTATTEPPNLAGHVSRSGGPEIVSISVVFYRDPMMPLLMFVILIHAGRRSELWVSCLSLPHWIEIHRTTDKLFLVVSAAVLAKPNVSSLPDPFAVIIVDSEQTRTTSVIKKTLNPYWNEYFDLSVVLFSDPSCPWS